MKMTPNSPGNETKADGLADDCEVYRAVLKPRFYDKRSKHILFGAFLRRPQDISGLSVYLKSLRTIESICQQFNLTAVGSLMVGDVRSVPVGPDLNVIQKGADPAHANSAGLPADGEDEIFANKLAFELARICRVAIQNCSVPRKTRPVS